MIVLGLLLVLGAVGLSVAAIWANQTLFEESAGAVDVLGYSVDATIGQVFLVGVAAGALALLGVFMLVSGVGHRIRRSALDRRRQRAQQDELLEAQRQKNAAEADLAARRARTDDRKVLDADRNDTTDRTPAEDKTLADR